MPAKKEPASGFMFALKKGCADHFVCNWGGLRPPIDGCKEKEPASGFMLALKEGCADHFVCNWGGLRPPQPPRFLKAIDGCTKRTSVRIYACAKGSLKAIDGCKEKEQASGFMLALKEGCADHFVCNWGGAAPPPTPPLFKGHR